MDPGIYMGGGACTYCRGVCGPHFNTYILKILPKNEKKKNNNNNPLELSPPVRQPFLLETYFNFSFSLHLCIYKS